MSKAKKDGTKTVPSPTEDEDERRVRADTVVATTGPDGMRRARDLLREIVGNNRITGRPPSE